MTIRQLRIYEIEEGKLDEFVQIFCTGGIIKVREKYGFSAQSAWINREKNEFIWIVSYPGSLDDFKVNENLFYKSKERAELKPNPSDYVKNHQVRFISSIF